MGSNHGLGWHLFAFVASFFVTPAAVAMLPADAVYCNALGYDYFTARTNKGTIGVCALPNGKWVNSWAFYTGKVALEWSYCARQGYEARRDESGSICHGCLVCTLPNGDDVWVVTLMGLSFKGSVCGDGHCGTAEDHDNCPGDCPSGGLDYFCDGIADQLCDPDCVSLGGIDADCPDLFVDIEPGACPNLLNIRDIGTLPIAITGTVNLGVADIDPDSIRLSRKGFKKSIAGTQWHLGDVATPNPAGACNCWSAPGDRRQDIIVHFDMRDAVKKLGISSEVGDTVALTIKARLKSGEVVLGQDCVSVFRPNREGICSRLGYGPKPSKQDKDVFRFKGKEGEKVEIILQANKKGSNNGGSRATLILMDKIPRVRLHQVERGALPNTISASLPADGEYRIIVREQRFNRDKSFEGDYYLMVEGAFGNVEPMHWVEP
jgi:putative hemolysin